MVEAVLLFTHQELHQDLELVQVFMDLIVLVMDLVAEVLKDGLELQRMVVLAELTEIMEEAHHLDLRIMVLAVEDLAVLVAQENHKVGTVVLAQERLLHLEIQYLPLHQMVED
tara:strand:+ start:262 stop:600 length:339 start_codon:yes stop_codon:yes gene_type:complete